MKFNFEKKNMVAIGVAIALVVLAGFVYMRFQKPQDSESDVKENVQPSPCQQMRNIGKEGRQDDCTECGDIPENSENEIETDEDLTLESVPLDPAFYNM